MIPNNIEQEDVARAAPSPILQDEISRLKCELADKDLELRAIREAMRNAQSLDQMISDYWRMLVIENVLKDNREFIDHWKNIVLKIDRRSNIK